MVDGQALERSISEREAEIERLQQRLTDAAAWQAEHQAENDRLRAGQDWQRGEIERLQRWRREAKGWLAACLGHVTGEGPPSWDGIRAFLAAEQSTREEK